MKNKLIDIYFGYTKDIIILVIMAIIETMLIIFGDYDFLITKSLVSFIVIMAIAIIYIDIKLYFKCKDNKIFFSIKKWAKINKPPVHEITQINKILENKEYIGFALIKMFKPKEGKWYCSDYSWIQDTWHGNYWLFTIEKWVPIVGSDYTDNYTLSAHTKLDTYRRERSSFRSEIDNMIEQSYSFSEFNDIAIEKEYKNNPDPQKNLRANKSNKLVIEFMEVFETDLNWATKNSLLNHPQYRRWCKKIFNGFAYWVTDKGLFKVKINKKYDGKFVISEELRQKISGINIDILMKSFVSSVPWGNQLKDEALRNYIESNFKYEEWKIIWAVFERYLNCHNEYYYYVSEGDNIKVFEKEEAALLYLNGPEVYEDCFIFR